MKVFIAGTGTLHDDRIYEVAMDPGKDALLVGDGEGQVRLVPTGELHWIGNAPIEVWGPTPDQ